MEGKQEVMKWGGQTDCLVYGGGHGAAQHSDREREEEREREREREGERDG